MRITHAVMAVGCWLAACSAAIASDPVATLATPLGVLTQQTKNPKLVVYADADGKTLYTYAGDTVPGKSACTGECETANPPSIAQKESLPLGWSSIKRADGRRQLAYHDKPLYTCAADDKPGSMKCSAEAADARGGSGRGRAAAAAAPVDATKAMWKPAAFNFEEKIAAPPGIGVADVAEAGGIALVNIKGMPLYTFTGHIERDQQQCDPESCGGAFAPVSSPYIAETNGDFSAITRPDGTRQWRYKGKPLYTFSGDQREGDARGKDVDRRYTLALLVKFFMPAGITIRSDPRVGGVFTTADGLSLYAKDGIFYSGDGRSTTRGGLPGFFDLGLAIGTVACDKDCTAQWHPLRAPGGAKPSGYWSILTREDGTRQWAYKNYALYSYAGDSQPGELNGREIYDVRINDFTQGYASRIDAMRAASGRGTAFLGYVWRAATP